MEPDHWKRQRIYERLLFWLVIVPLSGFSLAIVLGLIYLVIAFRQ